MFLRRKKQEVSSVPPHRRASAVTWRAVLLCLFLVPLSSYWQIQMESVRNATHPTAIALPFHVVFILLCLTGLNRLWARFFGEHRALNRGELLLVYSVLAIASALCGVDMLQILIPTVTYSFRFGDQNGWTDTINPYLPKWLTIQDPTVFERYYIGYGSLWQPTILAAWLPVVLRWTLFVALLLWVMLCINAIFRRAWTDNERLTFPIVQLPLQITEPETWSAKGLFGNPLFWAGFVVAAVPDIMNSLNYFYPGVPSFGYNSNGYSYVDLRYQPGVDQFLTRPPWVAMGETPISFYPFVIGLGILMPLDFLLSIPVFYWFWKLQKVAMVALALDTVPRFPYVENQAFGAYVSVCLLSIWVARKYLRDVWRKACGAREVLDDSQEPMPYTVAVWGGIAGAVGLVAFATMIGLTWWLAILFFVIYFGLALTVTRMRAELGTLVHDLPSTGPEIILTRVAGTRSFNTQDLIGFGMLEWFNRAYRSHPMPHQMESYKLADASQANRRSWTAALMVGGIFAAFVGFWVFLHLMYHYGAAARVQWAYGYETFGMISEWVNNPLKGDPGEAWAILVGFTLASLMQVARLYFPWFGLHPLAFAVTSSYQMNIIWLPLTMAGIIKWVLLRFGGLQNFRRALPFFFGLILGQFVIGSLWNIFGTLTEMPTYRFWD